jgi:hypothetical protein
MTAKKKNAPNVVSMASRSPVGPGVMLTTQNKGVTNYEEIQQNELAALQSIYMEEFEPAKVKAAAWSVRSTGVLNVLPISNLLPRNPQMLHSDSA